MAATAGQPGASTSSSNMTPSGSNGSGNAAGPNAGVLDGLPNTRIDTIELQNGNGRILCISDLRGNFSRLNELAAQHNARAVIHTGDFGLYDKDSIERMADRTLRHVLQFSTLIDPQVREKHFPSSPQSPNYPSLGQLRDRISNPPPELLADLGSAFQNSPNAFLLSEFPRLRAGEIKFNVPVYAVHGACEDIAIVEKFRLAPPSSISVPGSSQNTSSLPQTDEYAIPNLTVLNEGVTRQLQVGGVKLRLFGLGGSMVNHKLFDNGEGNATMAGGNGIMWATALQIGELVDTAQRVFDASETRMLITHASPGREGLLAQLALALKCDFTLSGSLHFRYSTSYNDYSVRSDTDSYRNKFVQSNKTFMEVYDSVRNQVESVVDDAQRRLLNNALNVARRVPEERTEEAAWKTSWNWNLPDCNNGSLVLDIKDGRIGSEIKSTGFNFAYRLKEGGRPHNANGTGGQSTFSNAQQHQQRGPIAGQSNNNKVPFQAKSTPFANGPGPNARGQSTAINGSASSPAPAPASNGQAPILSGHQANPPSSDAFRSAASSVFPRGAGAGGIGPHRGTSSGPGRGRGRGHGNLNDFVQRSGNGHGQTQNQNQGNAGAVAPAEQKGESAQIQTSESVAAAVTGSGEGAGNDAGSTVQPAAEVKVPEGASNTATAAGAGQAQSPAPQQQQQNKKPFNNEQTRPRPENRSNTADNWRSKPVPAAAIGGGEGGEASSGGEGASASNNNAGNNSRGGRGGHQNRGRGGEFSRGGGRGGHQGDRQDRSSSEGGQQQQGSGENRGGFGGRGRGGPRGSGRGRGFPNSRSASGAGEGGNAGAAAGDGGAKPSAPAPPAAAPTPNAQNSV